MADTVITQEGINAVHFTYGSGSLFALKYFLPIYDPRIDPNIHNTPVNNLDPLSILQLSAVCPTSANNNNFFGDRLFNLPGNDISDNINFLYRINNEGSLSISGSNAYLTGISQKQPIQVNTFRGIGPSFTGANTVEMISGTSISGSNGSFYVQNYGVIPRFNENTLGQLSDRLFKVHSFAPAIGGSVSADRGQYTAVLDASVGNFKFNKIAFFVQKVNSDFSDYTGFDPILFCITPMASVAIKTSGAEVNTNGLYGSIGVDGMTRIDHVLEIEFSTDQTLTNTSYQLVDYWTALPAQFGHGIGFMGKAVIGTSGVDGSYNPLAQLTSWSHDNQLALAYSENKATFFKTTSAGYLEINTSASTDPLISLGYNNNLSGSKAFAIGHDNIVKNTDSGSIGNGNTIYTRNSLVAGKNNVLGTSATLTNELVFVFGESNNVINKNFVYGKTNTISNTYAYLNTIFGELNRVINGRWNLITGYNNENNGDSNFITGIGNKTGPSSSKSLVGGSESYTDANYSISYGLRTSAFGDGAMCFGAYNYAKGSYSFTNGNYNNAFNFSDFVLGHYNSAGDSTKSGSDTLLGSNFVMGYANTSTGIASFIIGKANNLTKSDKILNVGEYNLATSASNGVMIGNFNKFNGNTNQFLLGNYNVSNAKETLIVGTSVSATGERILFNGSSVNISNSKQVIGVSSASNIIDSENVLTLGSTLTVSASQFISTIGNGNSATGAYFGILTGYGNIIKTGSYFTNLLGANNTVTGNFIDVNGSNNTVGLSTYISVNGSGNLITSGSYGSLVVGTYNELDSLYTGIIGVENKSFEDFNFISGYNNKAYSQYTAIFGRNNAAGVSGQSEEFNFIFGDGSTATHGAYSMGTRTAAYGRNSFVGGLESSATSQNSFIYGYKIVESNKELAGHLYPVVGLGHEISISSVEGGNIALGSLLQSKASKSFIAGFNNSSFGMYDINLGYLNSTGLNGVETSAFSNVAIGYGNTATAYGGQTAVAIGGQNTIQAAGSVGIGWSNRIGSLNTLFTNVFGTNNDVYGSFNNVFGNNNFIQPYGSSQVYNNCFIIGRNTNAKQDGTMYFNLTNTLANLGTNTFPGSFIFNAESIGFAVNISNVGINNNGLLISSKNTESAAAVGVMNENNVMTFMINGKGNIIHDNNGSDKSYKIVAGTNSFFADSGQNGLYIDTGIPITASVMGFNVMLANTGYMKDKHYNPLWNDASTISNTLFNEWEFPNNNATYDNYISTEVFTNGSPEFKKYVANQALNVEPNRYLEGNYFTFNTQLVKIKDRITNVVKPNWYLTLSNRTGKFLRTFEDFSGGGGAEQQKYSWYLIYRT